MRPQIYLDMDDTFYNWRAMLEPIREDLRQRGYTDEQFDHALEKANARGFSFYGFLLLLGLDDRRAYADSFELDRHISCGMCYTFPSVSSVLYQMSKIADLHLLTFGYKPYQRAKWAGLDRLHQSFTTTNFVYNDRTKGEVIASSEYSEDLVIFCDDNPRELLDVRAKAPWCKCVRMRHRTIPSEDHPCDGIQWAVVHDMHELLAWVYEQLNGVSISFASPNEYDEARCFINERGEELLRSGFLPELDAEACTRLFDQGRIAVARTPDNQIVGSAMIYFGQTWRQCVGHVEYVLVDPKYRKRGIGHMLLTALHGEARGRDVGRIRLLSEHYRHDAQRLYWFLGYKLEAGSSVHFSLSVG